MYLNVKKQAHGENCMLFICLLYAFTLHLHRVSYSFAKISKKLADSNSVNTLNYRKIKAIWYIQVKQLTAIS